MIKDKVMLLSYKTRVLIAIDYILIMVIIIKILVENITEEKFLKDHIFNKNSTTSMKRRHFKNENYHKKQTKEKIDLCKQNYYIQSVKQVYAYNLKYKICI